jgi:hypothetical protein
MSSQYIITRLQAKAKVNSRSRVGIVRNPDPPVDSDLPGIVGATAVVKTASRSLDGSSTHSRSPPADSPPAPYESPPRPEGPRQEGFEPVTPQHMSRSPAEGLWYPPQQHETPITQRISMDIHTQYPSYVVTPEIYMQSARAVRPQQDLYAWQRDANTSTVVVPTRYQEPHSQHPQHEIYQSMSGHQQYQPYHHPMAPQAHSYMPDHHTSVVAPDQNWSHFLGRMGVQ